MLLQVYYFSLAVLNKSRLVVQTHSTSQCFVIFLIRSLFWRCDCKWISGSLILPSKKISFNACAFWFQGFILTSRSKPSPSFAACACGSERPHHKSGSEKWEWLHKFQTCIWVKCLQQWQKAPPAANPRFYQLASLRARCKSWPIAPGAPIELLPTLARTPVWEKNQSKTTTAKNG